MTDRELLELAAKAYVSEDWRGNPQYMQGFISRWNPLTDDGDALRLAVKLGEFDLDELLCRYGDDPLIDTSKDPLAAIRRAIVMAAAEIGRSMK